MESIEVADIERDDGPSLAGSERELFLVRLTQQPGFPNGHDVEAAGSRARTRIVSPESSSRYRRMNSRRYLRVSRDWASSSRAMRSSSARSASISSWQRW